jgi:hypothetical protein
MSVDGISGALALARKKRDLAQAAHEKQQVAPEKLAGEKVKHEKAVAELKQATRDKKRKDEEAEAFRLAAEIAQKSEDAKKEADELQKQFERKQSEADELRKLAEGVLKNLENQGSHEESESTDSSESYSSESSSQSESESAFRPECSEPPPKKPGPDLPKQPPPPPPKPPVAVQAATRPPAPAGARSPAKERPQPQPALARSVPPRNYSRNQRDGRGITVRTRTRSQNRSDMRSQSRRRSRSRRRRSRSRSRRRRSSRSSMNHSRSTDGDRYYRTPYHPYVPQYPGQREEVYNMWACTHYQQRAWQQFLADRAQPASGSNHPDEENHCSQKTFWWEAPKAVSKWRYMTKCVVVSREAWGHVGSLGQYFKLGDGGCQITCLLNIECDDDADEGFKEFTDALQTQVPPEYEVRNATDHAILFEKSTFKTLELLHASNSPDGLGFAAYRCAGHNDRKSIAMAVIIMRKKNSVPKLYRIF